MFLSDRIADQVPHGVRIRGRQYYTHGAVRIIYGDPRSVYARVRGTSPYDVSLAREDGRIRVWCSCPYYQGGRGPCKHVWAAVLQAETRGHLQSWARADRVTLESQDPEAIPPFVEDAWEAEGRSGWQMARPHDGPRGHDPRRGGPPVRDDRGGQRPARQGEDRGRNGHGGQRPPPRADGRGRIPQGAPDDQRYGPHRGKGRRGWKSQLGTMRDGRPPRGAPWPGSREIVYTVDVPATTAGDGLVLDVGYRVRKRGGAWSRVRRQAMDPEQVAQLPDPADRQIMACLRGAEDQAAYTFGPGVVGSRFRLPAPLQESLVPLLCATGRCRLRRVADEPEPRVLRWDAGPAWELWVEVTRDEAARKYRVTGTLRRGRDRLDVAAPPLLMPGGLVFGEDWAGRVDDLGAFEWALLFRQHGPVTVPLGQGDALLKELFRFPKLPRLDLPEELRFEEVAPPAQPRIRIKADRRGYAGERLVADLSFDYGGEVVPALPAGQFVYQSGSRRLIRRNPEAENAAHTMVEQLGFKLRTSGYADEPLELAPRHLPKVVRALLAAGWHVEAEGKLYRQPGPIRMEVKSGVDWFELHGTVSFGKSQASLPELLAAVKRGQDTVRLGDGTYGVLPEDWLKKYGVLAGLGAAEEDHLRFARNQVGLLDALVASQPDVGCDAAFAKAREEFARFTGVESADAPPGFTGTLRGYQRDGLGWMYFLQRFGFGGCLADDMGLGKTVQVLALLESRRALRANPGDGTRPKPSLAVVPKSLIFNWREEAARFTPELRVLDHTGPGRAKTPEGFDDYDLILTTYGTMRRDAQLFKDFEFDYCILDEAQAVKNASTASAKAVRLLRAPHRLALSGTPVENHLGELWSLFDFLNPGMLGRASVLRLGGTGARNPDPETRELLARALRPFILRRTKDQVARDLPEKLEQTVWCELEPPERRRYDELREHYRRSLIEKVNKVGLRRATMHVLEALLRLRQASCHPGLLDPKKAEEPSAKLETLLAQLEEVLDEGHKALVFSQFTTLLGIVRDRLDREGVVYEYLDGKTRDRAARVERFQTDPDCKLFLISLKAGGLGLNLTAAEYVFLLDPWWNPAVEAQAVDRAHRIGQTRPVFAYRLIAKDTVEEKVLELQRSKRALADAIINADNSLIRDLGRDDLELLLS